jgi:hypothetical protein
LTIPPDVHRKRQTTKNTPNPTPNQAPSSRKEIREQKRRDIKKWLDYQQRRQSNHYPATLSSVKTTNIQTSNSAALNMRSFCVFGSTSSHTKAHTAMIIHNRKTTNRMLLNTNPYYPF